MSMIGITTLFLSLSLLYLHSILDVNAYSPDDPFTINCGSSGKSSDDERTWTGDINSKLLSTQDERLSVPAGASSQSPSTKQLPYTTARLSHSQFTYSFPITSGQKFIRLFFYPASYPSFDRSNALFTVKSGSFTLLKDFNASLTADADDENMDTIFREYCINVDDGQRLNVTFTPSTRTNPDAYAFINGIEIVSMPTNLYYTKSDGQGLKFVGHSGNPFPVDNNSALETQYRLNVGGTTLSLRQDTGMLRTWDGDDEFVKMKNQTALPVAIKPVDVTYSIIPNYTAPTEIYATARSMGMNASLSRMVNMTWEFFVDSGFTYMVRLHFCELDPNITGPADRAFFIYIAEQLADDHADVMRWTRHWGVPIYKDYAVSMSGSQKKAKLSLQMHPLLDSQTRYSDAFLNGLEIFKISDPGSKSLAGPNPDPRPTSLTPPNSGSSVQIAKKDSSRTTTIIGVVAGVVAVVVLLSIVVVLFVTNRRKRVNDSKSTDAASKWGPLSFATTKSTNTQGSSLPSDRCRYFSLADIKGATNNFDALFIIGVGGFGNVYKGYIDNGTTPVAIKRLKPGSQQGAHEFKTEIEMLSQLRHLHLVSLIGYCNENNEMILVYDFMARGTLRDHLYKTDNPPLTWKQRLQICMGAARGLHYLHTGATHVIIHRDVKSTNILVDEKWVAKVSDFGLSRIGPTGVSKAHVSTMVKGSVGYLDPEYYKRNHLTEKSDVYSFGVVLFEILCARPALIRTAEKKQVSLADWARHCYQMGTLAHIVDPALKGTIAPECLRKFGEIAVNCLLDDGSQRPTMSDVVWGLEFALQLQENAEQREQVDVEGGKSIEESDDLFSSGTSVGQVSDFHSSSGVSMTTSSGKRSSGNEEAERLISATAFSEIMDPKGR